MSLVLWCYLAALAICAAAFAALYIFQRKIQKIKLHTGFFFGGLLFSIAYFVGIMALFRMTFTSQDYYNTIAFRTMVGMVFLAILCFIRFLILKIFFFNHDRNEQGFSFSFGFGIAPSAFLAAYLLIMLIVVAFNGLFNGPCIVEENGCLSFADNTIISIFRPVSGHLSFAFLFLLFCGISYAFSLFIEKICARNYSPVIVVVWLILLLLPESVLVLVVPFMKMYSFEHWHLLIIAFFCALASFLLVKFIPLEQKPESYTQQFE